MTVEEVSWASLTARFLEVDMRCNQSRIARKLSFTALLLSCFLVLAASPVRGQSSKNPSETKPGQSKEQLSPETQALITKLRDEAKSKTAATRATAYKAMGELGTKGKSIRRDLTQGMLDSSEVVRTAAADALKKVDEQMYQLALKIYIDRNQYAIRQAAELGQAAEPLTPLLMAVANSNSYNASRIPRDPRTDYDLVIQAREYLIACATALAKSSPSDPAVNQAIMNLLTNQIPELRQCGLQCLGELDNKKLSAKVVVQILLNPKEDPENRILAAKLTPELVDINTKKPMIDALAKLRFDTNPSLREAVEKSLEKLMKD